MEAAMTKRETAVTGVSDPESWFTWQDLLEQIRAPLNRRSSEGPWSGSSLPPMAHRVGDVLDRGDLATGDDLDIVLLEDVVAWIEAGWEFQRVIHYTPETYQRGLEIASAAGLRRVDREGPRHSQGGTELTQRPSYAAFEWVRP
jgi:hypothetical protein